MSPETVDATHIFVEAHLCPPPLISYVVTQNTIPAFSLTSSGMVTTTVGGSQSQPQSQHQSQ